MPSIQQLLASLDERALAQAVGIAHDNTRARYPLNSNTVGDYDEYTRELAQYLAYHNANCLAMGGRLTQTEAAGQAKEIIEDHYRRHHMGDLTSAYHDASSGTNGGLRSQLDIICDELKRRSLERHIRNLFERHVAPHSWNDKVEIIRQFISHVWACLPSEVRNSPPERYAQNYQELIRSYVEGLREASSIFRRL